MKRESCSAKVGEIDNTPTSYPVFIKEYPWIRPYWSTTGYTVTTSNNNGETVYLSNTEAFKDAGRMEATQ